MVGKRVSGQTIAIIILAVLLLLAIAFGGVYAYYSAQSNKITGKIVMANLNINLFTKEGDQTDDQAVQSGKSEIVISNGTNVVPGQELLNSPLMVVNYSNAPIYLVVVYEVNADEIDAKGNKIPNSSVTDEKVQPIIDIGSSYINPYKNLSPESNSVYAGTNTDWIDYVFTYQNGEELVQYRCLVSTSSYYKGTADYETIEVIGKDKLRLHRFMGDDYQQTSISFAFQAYAIGADTFTFTNETDAEKCETIVNAIYTSVENKFLDATINN